jgi:uncharacterized protein YraI
MVFGYNRVVYRIHIFLLIIISIICTGCNANSTAQTAVPDFVTAVLPLLPTPLSALTGTASLSTAPVLSTVATSVIIPIEGTTNTQINVRKAPSTASETLGTINIFSKIQVTGKDASGSWYQIIYAGSENGNGWVRAEYVQVDAAAEITVIGAEAGSGSAANGLVIQKINIRSGPATTFESLGVLNPNDVVFITGKDPSGAWMQIQFSNAPEGIGWAASEFLQVANPDSLPVIGEAEKTEGTPTDSTSPQTITPLQAIEDGDSMQAPSAITFLSSATVRALQITGDVSAPGGDLKDWVQFSTDNTSVVLKVICSSASLQVELWNDGMLVDSFLLPCGNKKILTVSSNTGYFLSLSIAPASENQYTKYSLKLETLR